MVRFRVILLGWVTTISLATLPYVDLSVYVFITVRRPYVTDRQTDTSRTG